MGTRALNNRVKKIKELERQKAELEKAIEELKAEIKAEMESKDVKELNTGLYVIRFKEVKLIVLIAKLLKWTTQSYTMSI